VVRIRRLSPSRTTIATPAAIRYRRSARQTYVVSVAVPASDTSIRYHSATLDTRRGADLSRFLYDFHVFVTTARPCARRGPSSSRLVRHHLFRQHWFGGTGSSRLEI